MWGNGPYPVAYEFTKGNIHMRIWPEVIWFSMTGHATFSVHVYKTEKGLNVVRNQFYQGFQWSDERLEKFADFLFKFFYEDGEEWYNKYKVNYNT